MRKLLFHLLFVASTATVACAVRADEPKAASPPPGQAQATDFEEPLEPFVPLRARTQREEDRVKALGLFAGGRVAEQKQDPAKALFCYQRAFRLDPDALAVLREIVPLAFNLDRQAEAIRYALILAENDPSDPVLLRRLAIYLSESGNAPRAIRLYKQALAIPVTPKQAASNLLLHAEVGRLYFMSRNYEQAARHFLEVDKALVDPQTAGLDTAMQRTLVGRPELTYQLFGEAYLETGRTAEATAAFDKANLAKPDEALYAYNQARISYREKRSQEAIDKLQVYFDKQQSNRGLGPYQLLCDALGELGQADSRLARIEALRAVDPSNVPLAFFLADRYRQAGRLDLAEAIYSDLLDRQRTRPQLEAYVGLCEVYMQQKDAAKLLTHFENTTSKLGSLEVLETCVDKLKSDPQLLAAVFARARERLANEPGGFGYAGRLATAQIASEAEDTVTTDAFYEAAVAADESKATESLVLWGLGAFADGRYEVAVKAFERALAIKKSADTNAAIEFYMSGALEMMGRTDEALAAARRAVDAEPDSPRYLSRPAWIEYHSKRQDAARASYQALIEKFGKAQEPADVREVIREARLALSNIAVSEGKASESEEWLVQVLDEFPDDAGALNDLGYLWADSERHLERALGMIQRAVEQEPNNLAFRDSLGWVLHRLGRTTEAVAELRKACEGEDPDGVILDHLADAQAKSGDAQGAVESWTRAAAAFEKQSEPDKAKLVREKIARQKGPGN